MKQLLAALAASAALAAPVSAQSLYNSVTSDWERDRQIRQVVRDELRFQELMDRYDRSVRPNQPRSYGRHWTDPN